MVKMFKYLKPYWLLAVAAPLFMLLEVMMDLMQPLFMQRIVDVGIANKDMDYVLSTLVLMLGVALIGFVGGVGCSYFSAKASINMSTDIRDELFTHVQNLSYGNVDRLKTGNLITRLTNDIVQVQRIVMLMMRIMVRSPLQIIGSLIMTYIISPRLFLILLALVPILIGAMAIILSKGFPLYRIVQQKLDRVNTVMQENLSGIRVVKAFVREDFEKDRFSEANEDFSKTTVTVSRTMAVMSPVTMILLNVGVVAVLWFGNVEVQNGQMQVGKVMAFINYLLQLLNSLMMFANMMMMYSRGQASAERIGEVFDEVPDITDAKETEFVNSLSGDLVFDNVTFSYGSHAQEPVLKGVSFVAKPGEKVAIIGSTGSGKSSLVNLIPRLYDVTNGSITIGGKNVKDINRNALRNHIGMVLQQTFLFSGTIMENITYGKEDAKLEEVLRVSKVAGAHEFIESFEAGYETELGQKAMNISGGQKQRISIARGLLRQPYILILDDSTSAVDVATEAKIQKSLKEITGKSIVILVAQRISSILDADRILVLEEGCIVGNGSHETLMKDNQAYREIYESQLGK
ncbi:MAG: ABC transporter ATP-binding protein [Sedimentibacter sp.]